MNHKNILVFVIILMMGSCSNHIEKNAEMEISWEQIAEKKTEEKIIGIIDHLEKNLDDNGNKGEPNIQNKKINTPNPIKKSIVTQKQESHQMAVKEKRDYSQTIYSDNQWSMASYYENAKTKEKYIVINNRFFGPYEELDFCQFNSEGSEFAFAFLKKGKWYMQVNEEIFEILDLSDFNKCNRF